MKPIQTPFERMAPEAIDEALRLPDRKLIRTVLAYAREYAEEHLKVKSVLDDKGQKYFGMAATLLTVLATLGSFLAHMLSPLPHHPWVFMACFFSGGACLLLSAGFFFQANRPRVYDLLGHGEILNETALSNFGTGQEEPALKYAKSMARHFIHIGLTAMKSNYAKVTFMRRGERCLMAGLAFILLDLGMFALAMR